jgi:hypothetical protein
MNTKQKLTKKERLQKRREYYAATREAYLQRMRDGYHRRKAEAKKKAALPVKKRGLAVSRSGRKVDTHV